MGLRTLFSRPRPIIPTQLLPDKEPILEEGPDLAVKFIGQIYYLNYDPQKGLIAKDSFFQPIDYENDLIAYCLAGPPLDTLPLMLIALNEELRIFRSYAYLSHTVNQYNNYPASSEGNIITLSYWANNGDLEVVAKSRRAGRFLYEYVLKTGEEIALADLASNIDVPSSILARLVQTPSIYVRINLANNPNISNKTIALLAKDEEEHVRNIIFRRQDPALDEIFCHDPSLPIRLELAKRNCNAHIEEILSTDSKEEVRAEIATSSCNLPLLKKLAHDPSSHVRTYALTNPIFPQSWLADYTQDPSFHVRLSAVSRIHNSHKILSLYVNDSEERVRSLVAWHPKATIKILQTLSLDPSEHVSNQARIKLAKKMHTKLLTLTNKIVKPFGLEL